MKYSEKQAFIQFFQIIVLMIALCLEIYAFIIDAKWNATVERHKIFSICPWLVKSVDKKKYEEIIAPVLQDHSNDPAKDWWEKGANGTILKIKSPKKDVDFHAFGDKKYFKEKIFRKSGAEKWAIALMSISVLFLTVHLFFACLSNDRSYRTKWTASVQGTVIFLMGFSAILLAMSAHDIDEPYNILSTMMPECEILGVCDFKEKGFHKQKNVQEFLKHHKYDSKNSTASNFEKLISAVGMCQEFQIKIWAAIICGVIVFSCFFVTCYAIELTTIYDEQDIDEEEKKRRQHFHIQALHAKRKMDNDPPSTESVLDGKNSKGSRVAGSRVRK